MADVMTFEQHRGAIAGRVVTWSGDGNNVANSWIHAAARFKFELRLACPDPLRPAPELLAWAKGEGARVSVGDDPAAAARGADCLVTDTWMSMDAEGGNGRLSKDKRHNLLAPFQVNERLMAQAKPNALFMHCLPAHRGEEVEAEVIDGPQSVVWDEAENRMHVQKALMEYLLLGRQPA